MAISRERWTFDPSALSFAHAATTNERFVEARRFRDLHQMPRFGFFKVPEEPKPFYLDFDSMVYVEMFARQMPKVSSVRITEMLPEPHESWLFDRDGHHYTSELRIVAVDPELWRSE